MSTAPPFSVGIIGLGRIAEGYDSPDSAGIATHIKACLQEPRLRLTWIADLDPTRAATVKDRWDLGAEIVSPDALIQRRPDILCIASPDETHGAWIEAALKTRPPIILCEKPLGATLADAQRLVAACNAAKVALVVNFPRRWLPGVGGWLTKARAGEYGAPVAARAVYCRGLRHNACHGLDLVGAALGADVSAVSRLPGHLDDFSAVDPTVSATLTVKSAGTDVPITLTGVDGRHLNAFETDILFTGGRLRIWNDGGIRVQIYGAGMPAAHGGTELRCEQEFHDNPPRHMLAVWQNLADYLSDGQPLLGRGEDTIAGTQMVEAVAQARPIPL